MTTPLDATLLKAVADSKRRGFAWAFGRLPQFEDIEGPQGVDGCAGVEDVRTAEDEAMDEINDCETDA